MIREVINFTKDLLEDCPKIMQWNQKLKGGLYILIRLDEEGNWKIISVFKTNTLSDQGEIFNYTISNFSNPKNFIEYIEEIKKRSLINIPIVAGADDKLLTLSTCSYEFKGFRTVVVAKKVKEGESLEIDTSLASKSENPLMPQCWYDRYGGVAPS